MHRDLDPVAAIRSVPLFSALDQAALERICGIARRRRYKRGSAIFFEQDPGDSLLVIMRGTVKIYKASEHGQEKTLALLEAGDFFGEMGVFCGAPRSASAEALSDCEVLVIERDRFLELMNGFPGLAAGVALALAERLRRTDEDLGRLAFRDARGRVVEALLQLSGTHGEPAGHGVRLTLRLTHRELANYAGVSRETATRLLTELQDSGLVALDEERHIIIRDEDGLRAFIT